VSALSNNVEVQVPLSAAFQLRTDKILGAVDKPYQNHCLICLRPPVATRSSVNIVISLEEISKKRGCPNEGLY